MILKTKPDRPRTEYHSDKNTQNWSKPKTRGKFELSQFGF